MFELQIMAIVAFLGVGDAVKLTPKSETLYVEKVACEKALDTFKQLVETAARMITFKGGLLGYSISYAGGCRENQEIEAYERL
ncbi:hypothetical protein C4556_03670 [Candidatus Parcubacteria bacterium]|nr:MAG: hypothetical protein C4556_03670 [Candidatus Parcubacteria bacterium]